MCVNTISLNGENNNKSSKNQSEKSKHSKSDIRYHFSGNDENVSDAEEVAKTNGDVNDIEMDNRTRNSTKRLNPFTKSRIQFSEVLQINDEPQKKIAAHVSK